MCAGQNCFFFFVQRTESGNNSDVAINAKIFAAMCILKSVVTCTGVIYRTAGNIGGKLIWRLRQKTHNFIFTNLISYDDV